jgi:flagellar basal-body rod modification protein FlgD
MDQEKATRSNAQQGGNMGTVLAIMNHDATTAQGLGSTPAASTTAKANATSSTSSSTSDSATISANDFLTLLVTEMQNQDPTSDVDPNEYINQLVNVNSLEQLISINKTLTTDHGSTASTSSTSDTSAKASGVTGVGSSGTNAASASASTTVPGAISAAAAQLAPGNLSVPVANSAANRVAGALSGLPGAQ